MVPTAMDLKIGNPSRKVSAILLVLLICAAGSGNAVAQSQSSHLGEVNIVPKFNHSIKTYKPVIAAKEFQPVLTMGDPVSNQALAGINGKGVPVNLPSMGHQSSTDVVLWDELQTRGGGKSAIQMGGLNNMQSISMAANR